MAPSKPVSGLNAVAALTENCAPRLSALEWSAVAVARRDRLATLSAPSRMAKALGTLFDVPECNPRLADANLEALRRAAVYAWHGSDQLPPREEISFRSAGFSSAHYDLIRASVAAAQSHPA